MSVGNWGKINNAELVNRLKQGEERAFSILLEEFSPLIFSLIDRMIFDRSHREDLAQEIFVKVIENIGWFRGNSKLSSWIYTIAYRHLLDFIRSGKRDIVSKANSIDDSERYQTEIADESDNAEDNMQQLQLGNTIVEALNKLPEKYRVPVHLQFIDGLPQKEIADILDISINGVKTRGRRGLLMLREDMDQSNLDE